MSPPRNLLYFLDKVLHWRDLKRGARYEEEVFDPFYRRAGFRRRHGRVDFRAGRLRADDGGRSRRAGRARGAAGARGPAGTFTAGADARSGGPGLRPSGRTCPDCPANPADPACRPAGGACAAAGRSGSATGGAGSAAGGTCPAAADLCAASLCPGGAGAARATAEADCARTAGCSRPAGPDATGGAGPAEDAGTAFDPGSAGLSRWSGGGALLSAAGPAAYAADRAGSDDPGSAHDDGAGRYAQALDTDRADRDAGGAGAQAADHPSRADYQGARLGRRSREG